MRGDWGSSKASLLEVEIVQFGGRDKGSQAISLADAMQPGSEYGVGFTVVSMPLLLSVGSRRRNLHSRESTDDFAARLDAAFDTFCAGAGSGPESGGAADVAGRQVRGTAPPLSFSVRISQPPPSAR